MENETFRFSLEPDESMRWIYDTRHPDYYSDQAEDLRERRRAALLSCPGWMLNAALANDERRKAMPNVEIRGGEAVPLD